jgi:hypothetical protein
MKKQLLIVTLIFIQIFSAFLQRVTVVYPNKKVLVTLNNRQNSDVGDWYVKVSYRNCPIKSS